MMNFIKNMSINRKLTFLISICVLGFIIMGSYFYYTFNNVKINSSLYMDISQGKDLVADILPPNEYILEPYSVILQMLSTTDKSEINSMIAKSKELRAIYEQSHLNWQKSLTEGRIKDIMISDSYKPAEEFFDISEKEYIPAILAGDVQKAQELVNGVLKQKYTEHRQKIDELVKMATEQNIGYENEAKSAVSQSTMMILLLCLIIIAAVVFIGAYLGKIISRPIKKMVETADRLALGDTNVKVDAETRDEIGNLMNSFSKMIESTQEQALAVEKIASGNLSAEIRIKSDNDLLSIKLADMINTIKKLIEEMNNLSEAAVEGQLSVRGDAKKFAGDFGKIVDGVNSTLDAVVQPMQEASAVLDDMAKGNLQVFVEGDYKGDHANIKKAINNTLASLNEDLSKINVTADQVASGSNQVSFSGQALSQGCTEQASSIEEITSSMTQIGSQTKQNAANANQANELAVTAKDNAAQGNSQMREMVNAMAEINESSTKISKIIKVIDEIAFQTNILALNAAVEAARAGQHGKGFAVVAEEVRNLAARSANAAKETTAMIEGSIKKVEVGTKIANETAEALNKIVTGVTKVADIVGDIAIASNEQATGITQVNQAIAQVSQVVQTNSATAEESASASEELSAQAGLLKDTVRKFQLRKMNSSVSSFEGLHPDVVNMLEGIIEKKKPAHAKQSVTPVHATTPKSKVIKLDSVEFGKY